jgi:peptidoglycan DL-endopeptidase RipA
VRSARAVVLLVLVGLLGGTATGLAQPPPNPSDDDLDRSRERVSAGAGEVGRLTAQLADLDARAEDLQIELAIRREDAEAADVVFEQAREQAAEATRRAEDSRIEIEAASAAVTAARERLDEFLTAAYQQGLDAGPLGLLSAATSPEELIARAEFTDAILREQTAAQDGLERARVDKANADSRARAALEDARAREAEAATAQAAAEDAFAVADSAAREQAELIAGVDAERAQVQRRLDELTAADAGLRAQRSRFEEWEQVQAQERAAQERAAQAAAAARLGAGDAPAAVARGSVRTVIDRAVSQLGVQYVWGGGNGRGPSTGIPDAFGSPLDRIGFDCSGLMLFAFNGAGVSLPRVSRNQFNAGRKVPISQLQPGDMVFYKKGSAPIHHVALFIGDGKMVEAPYTGANVRIVPLRTQNLLPQATRML